MDTEWDEIPDAGGARRRSEEGGEEGGIADHRTTNDVNEAEDLNDMTIPVEGGMEGLQVDSVSGPASSADQDVLARSESSIQTSQLRKTFEDLAQASSAVPKPQPPSNRGVAGSHTTPERRRSPPSQKTSPEVVGSDGVVYTNEDISVIASMLLNPHKARGSLQENPSPSEGTKLSKHVREALKVIVCSPSRRASAMLQHFREKERTDIKPILPNFDTPSKADRGLAKRVWKGSSAADRAALAQTQSPFFNRMKAGKKSAPLRPSTWKGQPTADSTKNADAEPEIAELGFEVDGLQEVGDDSLMNEQERADLSEAFEEAAEIDGLQAEDLELDPDSQVTQPAATIDDADDEEESVDLVQRVLDRLDLVTDMVCAHDKTGSSADDAFINPKTALLAELISLRSAQLALIQDHHRAAVGSVQGTKAVFERLAFLQCHGDMDKAVSDMERAELKLQAEIRAMARASADERWAYYSRRGNESLHKASMCLAGGRFDHALAFIAQAKGAFTTIGDVDKLSFLQDMNRRVVLEATRHGTPDVAQLTAEDDARSAKSTQREEAPHRGALSPPISPGNDDNATDQAPLSGLDLLATPSPITSHASAKVLRTRSFQSPSLATPSEDAPAPVTPSSLQRAASARVLATRQASVPLQEEGEGELSMASGHTQPSPGPSPKVLHTRQFSASGDPADETAGSGGSPSSTKSASHLSPSAKVLATRLLPSSAEECSGSESELSGSITQGPTAKVLAMRPVSPEVPDIQDGVNSTPPSTIHGGPSAKVLSTRNPHPRTPLVDLQESLHATDGQLEAASVHTLSQGDVPPGTLADPAMQTPPGASQGGLQIPTPGVITGPQYPPDGSFSYARPQMPTPGESTGPHYPPDGSFSTPLPTHSPGWLATTPVDPPVVQGTPEEYQGLTQDPCYLHLNKGGSPFIVGGDDPLTMGDGTGGLVVAADTSLPSLARGRNGRRQFVDGFR